MYITCPDCQTKFIVLKEQIGINGRRVKCSKCHHIWHQKLDYKATKLTDFGKIEKADEFITTPFKEEFCVNNLPVIFPNKSLKSNILPLLWISFIIFSLIILLEDNCEFLFKCDKLKIENILIQDIKNTGKIKISYQVTNTSAYQISNLIIRLRIIDKNHKILDSYVTNELNVDIPPSQSVNTVMELDQLPPFSEYLDIAMGSKFDFLFK